MWREIAQHSGLERERVFSSRPGVSSPPALRRICCAVPIIPSAPFCTNYALNAAYFEKLTEFCVLFAATLFMFPVKS